VPEKRGVAKKGGLEDELNVLPRIGPPGKVKGDGGKGGGQTGKGIQKKGDMSSMSTVGKGSRFSLRRGQATPKRGEVVLTWARDGLNVVKKIHESSKLRQLEELGKGEAQRENPRALRVRSESSCRGKATLSVSSDGLTEERDEEWGDTRIEGREQPAPYGHKHHVPHQGNTGFLNSTFWATREGE